MSVRRIETLRGPLFVFPPDADPVEVVNLLRAEAGLPPWDADSAPRPPEPDGEAP